MIALDFFPNLLGPYDTDTGLCVLPVRGRPGFPSVPVFPHRESAEAAARLFSPHVGAMPGSDFFARCIVGFGSRHAVCGPPPILRGSPKSFRAPALDIRACLAVYNTAGSASALAPDGAWGALPLTEGKTSALRTWVAG